VVHAKLFDEHHLNAKYPCIFNSQKKVSYLQNKANTFPKLTKIFAKSYSNSLTATYPDEASFDKR
jgi:hypothetical protein